MYAIFFPFLPFMVLAPMMVAPSTPPKLDLPLDCVVGTSCFISQYFDHDPGPARRDYQCGKLLSDGHDGIDFRIPRHAADVPVLAAAGGTVLRIRDEMPDRSVLAPGAHVPPDRMAGNSVIIDHGAFTTQYSHLKRGSVSIAPGQRVKAGQKVGVVGISGNTEYLHLHFSVRIADRKVDPFTGTSGNKGCAARPAASLWSERAHEVLVYQPSGVADAGFSPIRPTVLAAREGRVEPLGMNPSALILWADSFGIRPGDVQHFLIHGPSGNNLLDRRQPIATGALSWFGFAGLPRPPSGWAHGSYSGRYSLIRSGRTIGSITVRTTLGKM